MRKLRRIAFTKTDSEGRETTSVRMSSGEKRTIFEIRPSQGPISVIPILKSCDRSI